jgi:hypothetical protein
MKLEARQIELFRELAAGPRRRAVGPRGERPQRRWPILPAAQGPKQKTPDRR